jgi:hypothetical protein
MEARPKAIQYPLDRFPILWRKRSAPSIAHRLVENLVMLFENWGREVKGFGIVFPRITRDRREDYGGSMRVEGLGLGGKLVDLVLEGVPPAINRRGNPESRCPKEDA